MLHASNQKDAVININRMRFVIKLSSKCTNLEDKILDYSIVNQHKKRTPFREVPPNLKLPMNVSESWGLSVSRPTKISAERKLYTNV